MEVLEYGFPIFLSKFFLHIEYEFPGKSEAVIHITVFKATISRALWSELRLFD